MRQPAGVLHTQQNASPETLRYEEGLRGRLAHWPWCVELCQLERPGADPRASLAPSVHVLRLCSSPGCRSEREDAVRYLSYSFCTSARLSHAHGGATRERALPPDVGCLSGMLRAYVSPTHLVVPRISRVCLLPIIERCWLNKSGETKSKITITCLISQTTPARPPATRATRGVAGTVVAPSRGGCIYKILNLQNCKSSQSH